MNEQTNGSRESGYRDACVYLILAMDKNRVIGTEGRLPWHLPADIAYFKEITQNQVVVMGRKTHQSIERALPGRTNVVMSRQEDYVSEGCVIVHSVEELLTLFKGQELFVIGGVEIFKQFLPCARRRYITLIEHEFEGDSFFPEIDETVWVETLRKEGVKNKENPYTYYFLVYERKAEFD